MTRGVVVHCARTALQVTPQIRNSQVTRVLYQLKIHWGCRSCGVPVARARGEEAVLTWGPPVKVNVAWLHSLPPPQAFLNCIGNAGWPSHATSIFTTYPTPDQILTALGHVSWQRTAEAPAQKDHSTNTSPVRLQSR